MIPLGVSPRGAGPESSMAGPAGCTVARNALLPGFQQRLRHSSQRAWKSLDLEPGRPELSACLGFLMHTQPD